MKRQQDFWTTFSVMPAHDVFTDLSKTIICGRKDCVNVSE
ncbi:gNAT family acetyltransferase [Parabacteroides distasonis str. 3776 Po2 i]|uniref:GNAT family acetyltransferase n=1 Tax=Parabacteroides distasonis str. 3776 D15 i TaxID=1339342 RepID=A0AB34L910_PARDI|nr:gNAT family acetyltransferase [Parabacteroides distasonis str. 3776 D15 i]KDS43023.1 gNAT family acetyltransferase [Parabacteroides distasonis str. 3776 Po2 i]